MSINETIKKFNELVAKKSRIEDELDEVKEELKPLKEVILNYFAAEGVEKITVNGRTTYPKRTLWASANISIEDMVEGLKAAGEGWDNLVFETVNAQTLSAAIREYEKEAGDRLSPQEIDALLPEEIQGRIKITEKYDVGNCAA